MDKNLNYEDINNGDNVICINDQETAFITQEKIYPILNIWKCNNTDKFFFQIVDDGDYINSFEASRFKSKSSLRDDVISSLLIN